MTKFYWMKFEVAHEGAVSSLNDAMELLDSPMTTKKRDSIRAELSNCKDSLDRVYNICENSYGESTNTEHLDGWQEAIDELPKSGSLDDLLALKELIIKWRAERGLY